MDLPNLDYAFLAEYAKVEPSGVLNAVGASFTVLSVVQFPAAHLLSVAGRVRMAEGGVPFPLTISFEGPAPEESVISLEMMVAHGTETAYEGRVGVLFAATTLVPVVRAGLHHVRISIQNQVVRELAFDARPVHGQ